MSLHHLPPKLPDIRVPRLDNLSKLPEVKGGLRSSTSSTGSSDSLNSAKSSSRESHRDRDKDDFFHPPPKADRRDKDDFFHPPPKSDRKAKRTTSSIFDTSPVKSSSSRVGPAEPTRRRSTSSSWISSTNSPPSQPSSSSKPLVPPMESPKRAISQPTLLPSAADILAEQAQNTLLSVHPIPAFSTKKPLSLPSDAARPNSPSTSSSQGDALPQQRAVTPTKLNDLKIRNTRELKSSSELEIYETLRPLTPPMDTFKPHTPPIPSVTPRTLLAPITKNEDKGVAEHKVEHKVEPKLAVVMEKLESKDAKVDSEVEHSNANGKPESMAKDKEDSKVDSAVDIKRESKAEPLLDSSAYSKLDTGPTQQAVENKLEIKSPSRMRRVTSVTSPQDKVSPLQRCMATNTVQVFVGTWNMQGKPPPTSGLELFVTPGVYDAIGTEECETSIQRALLSPIKQKWEDKLCATLGSEYIMLPTATLGAVHLAVFIHLSLLPIMSDVRTGAIPTGLGNVVANKGGVAVTFQLGTTGFGFVAAHFTAHHNKVEQRNADFHRINTMLNLSPPMQVQIPPTPAPPQPPQLRKAKQRQSGSPSSSPTVERQSKVDVEALPMEKEKDPQEETVAKEMKDKETKDKEGEARSIEVQEEAKGEAKVGESKPEGGNDAASKGESVEKSPQDQTGPKQHANSTDFKQLTPELQQEQQEELKPEGAASQLQQVQQQPHQSQQRFNNVSLVERFDRLFWFGDLNYRINGNKKIVEESVKQGMIEVLVANDQLMIEKKKGNVFQGFLEGPLHFPPTYKYDPGTDNFDTSAKARIPSWTDRILFKTSEHVTLQSYTSCAELKYTDHRPVYASFGVGFSPPNAGAALGGGTGKGNGSKVCTIL